MAIARSAIAAVDAPRLVRAAFTAPRSSPSASPRTYLVAAGKASVSMARAFLEVGGEGCQGGVVVAPERDALPARLEIFEGGHPVPNAASEAAGRRALAMAARVRRDEQLIFLLSGGASALLAVPAGDLSLAGKMEVTRALLRSGAPIHEINCVRKHLSAIKGGRLAAAVAGATRTYAISDIVGPIEDDPASIGSGPTVADPTTFADALSIVDRYGLLDSLPAAAREHLRRGASGETDETPKPGDPRLARAAFALIGTRRDAMAGAREEATRLGYHVLVLEEPVVGEARHVAGEHLEHAVRALRDAPRPACVISSGETTVRVTGRGKGGRNQEFALAVLDRLRDLGPAAVLASFGTDGIDGPTDAAGALADGTSLERAAGAGLDPQRFLDDNDAYAFFDRLGDLIKTGPTGTNVADQQILLIG